MCTYGHSNGYLFVNSISISYPLPESIVTKLSVLFAIGKSRNSLFTSPTHFKYRHYINDIKGVNKHYIFSIFCPLKGLG